MQKWTVPDDAQSRVLEEAGIDPDGCVVAEVAQGQMLALYHKSGTEYYFRDGRMRVATDASGSIIPAGKGE